MIKSIIVFLKGNMFFKKNSKVATNKTDRTIYERINNRGEERRCFKSSNQTTCFTKRFKKIKGLNVQERAKYFV